MPFAHVIVPANALSVAKKQKMVQLVTDAILEAEEAPEAMRPYVTVLVSETADGGWGINGRGHTTAELGALVRGPCQNPGMLSEQLMLLFDGALVSARTRRDAVVARHARDAARVLLHALGVSVCATRSENRGGRRRRRSRACA